MSTGGVYVAADGSSSIILAGVGLGRYPHVCAFFEDRDEEYACFLPFIRDGIEAGEQGRRKR